MESRGAVKVGGEGGLIAQAAADRVRQALRRGDDVNASLVWC